MGDTRRFWIGFNKVHGIGFARLQALLDHFGDIESSWEAPPHELKRAGLGDTLVQSFVRARRELDLERELERVTRAGFKVITLEDPEYPDRLREIDLPPILLYCSGDIQSADRISVAIVGTRRVSPYGRQVAQRVAGELAAAGVTVVSGLARGTDGIAHRACLEAGGRTIAVLGSGLDEIYPPEHRGLARQIAGQGAVISDYPLGTKPEGGNFPPRNRIISGLSLAVVVVEAGKSSGALITADFAAEQGRDVFSVPGSIFNKNSLGTNRLIKDGAFPLTSSADVLEALNFEAAIDNNQMDLNFPEDEKARVVLGVLSEEPTHIDEIKARCSLSANEVAASLSMLELKGRARQVGRMKYVVVRETGPNYRVT